MNRDDIHPSRAVDDYLQTIYSLETEGEKAYSGRLARWMRVKPPTAWATVKRMERDGLVTVDDKKAIHLTDVGRELAEVIARRHRLSERFLTDVLGLGWAEGHEQAHIFEHGLTPMIEERLMHLLGNPKTCPHGSPIPGTGAHLDPALVPLDQLQEGDEAVLEFISEELEEDSGILKYLESHGLRPGARIRVREVIRSVDVLSLETDKGPASLGLAVAARIRVRPR
ncbi:MAG TPA: metal-dependent transcriptional regulator [Dehalococcoidia bacterium]|nr:metal-dependent transcriptional regulator [Dehalococcoidia bacterium]